MKVMTAQIAEANNKAVVKISANLSANFFGQIREKIPAVKKPRSVQYSRCEDRIEKEKSSRCRGE
jgi:hypothetical protein